MPLLTFSAARLATIHQIAAQTLGFTRMLATPQEVDLIELAEAALLGRAKKTTAYENATDSR